MSRWNKLLEKEREYGEPLSALIPRLIEQEGSIYRAAVLLGVGPTSLRHWLNKNGLHVETRQQAIVRDEESIHESA